ncbi:universal stress protein [bacterium]|nr:MAG: universal stress protein [bacterium]
MVTIKNIVVPTDFSEAASHALDYALSLAKTFQAKIYLMHVFEPIVYYSDAPMGMPDLIELEQNVRGVAEQSLQSILDKQIKEHETEFGAIPVETILAQGKPFIEIIQTAKEKNADLIVLSTHGRSALEHILLGSVTEKVVRKAHCPVLTIRSTTVFKMP